MAGKGNDPPLQYSCLENPMDGGAWWAAVPGVAKSRTRLKRLSSSRRWWMLRSWADLMRRYATGSKKNLNIWPTGRRSSYKHSGLSVVIDRGLYLNRKCIFSCIRLFAAPQTEAHQAPLSMEFPRQENWSGVLSPPPGDLPHVSGISCISRWFL